MGSSQQTSSTPHVQATGPDRLSTPVLLRSGYLAHLKNAQEIPAGKKQTTEETTVQKNLMIENTYLSIIQHSDNEKYMISPLQTSKFSFYPLEHNLRHLPGPTNRAGTQTALVGPVPLAQADTDSSTIRLILSCTELLFIMC